MFAFLPQWLLRGKTLGTCENVKVASNPDFQKFFSVWQVVDQGKFKSLGVLSRLNFRKNNFKFSLLIFTYICRIGCIGCNVKE